MKISGPSLEPGLGCDDLTLRHALRPFDSRSLLRRRRRESRNFGPPFGVCSLAESGSMLASTVVTRERSLEVRFDASSKGIPRRRGSEERATRRESEDDAKLFVSGGRCAFARRMKRGKEGGREREREERRKSTARRSMKETCRHRPAMKRDDDFLRKTRGAFSRVSRSRVGTGSRSHARAVNCRQLTSYTARSRLAWPPPYRRYSESAGFPRRRRTP